MHSAPMIVSPVTVLCFRFRQPMANGVLSTRTEASRTMPPSAWVWPCRITTTAATKVSPVATITATMTRRGTREV